MKSVLLLGAFGHPNFGDDLILKVWMSKYIEDGIIDGIVIDGINNNLLKKNMNIDFAADVNVTIQDPTVSLWKLKEEISFVDKKLHIKNKKVFFEKLLFVSSVIKQLNICKIHICGGGYINSMFFDNYFLLFICKFLSNNIGIPVILTGNGLTPADKNYSNLLDIFSCFDLVDVRDIESYSLAVERCNCDNVFLSGDDALIDFTLKNKISIFDDEKKSFIICLQNDLFPGEKSLEQIIDRNVIDFIKSNYERVLFLSAMYHDIHSANNNLINIMKSSGINVDFLSEIEILNMGLPFNEDSFFLTSRYHVHMMYSLNGMKGVSVVDNYYYKIKHSAVSTMGSKCPVVNKDMAREYILNPSIINNFSNGIRDEWIKRKENIVKKAFSIEKMPSNDFVLYDII